MDRIRDLESEVGELRQLVWNQGDQLDREHQRVEDLNTRLDWSISWDGSRVREEDKWMGMVEKDMRVLSHVTLQHSHHLASRKARSFHPYLRAIRRNRLRPSSTFDEGESDVSSASSNASSSSSGMFLLHSRIVL